MSVLTESSIMTERIKLRKPRNQSNNHISEPDPNPEIQSFRSRSNSFSNTHNETLPANIGKKKNNFSSTSFKGLGCVASASQKVSVPAKKKQNKYAKNKNRQEMSEGSNYISNISNAARCIDVQDVWCGPGIGLSVDAADSVNCVVARRSFHRRGTIGGVLPSQRERLDLTRRTLDSEIFSLLDSDSELTAISQEPDVFETTDSRNVESRSPVTIVELLSMRSRLLIHGRSNVVDRFRDLRLDIDSMSYEQLLDLGDTIGYVNTGLHEEEIGRCLAKTKTDNVRDFWSNISVLEDRKCSICQEEFESNNEAARLDCGHSYHVQCIKQWLARKNTCPVCKIAPIDRH